MRLWHQGADSVLRSAVSIPRRILKSNKQGSADSAIYRGEKGQTSVAERPTPLDTRVRGQAEAPRRLELSAFSSFSPGALREKINSLSKKEGTLLETAVERG